MGTFGADKVAWSFKSLDFKLDLLSSLSFLLSLSLPIPEHREKFEDMRL